MTMTQRAPVDDVVMRDDDQVEALPVRSGTGVIEVMSPATRAEVDIQISTAKHYPRSIKAFKEQAMAMATLDEETASGCFYAMPRGGKPIEGPSVRLAEIVLSSWGNIRADARVIDVGAREITAEGMCWDLERNIAIRVQVKRRITDRQGKRYSDDMIVVTGNAACSIALRNAVFKVIPMAFTRAVYDAARQVAIGDAKTLSAKRADMIAYFGKMGIQPERVCAAIGRPSVDDIGLEDLATLKGMATAIREGDTSVDEAFPELAKPEAAKANGSAAARVADKLGAAVAGEQPAATPVGDEVQKAAQQVQQARSRAKSKATDQQSPTPGVMPASEIDSALTGKGS